jgi:ribosomal protein S18 acetylase RimI-like enzyme
MLSIREYDSMRDRTAVRSCFVELQEFERQLDLRLPPGEEIADAYLEQMFRHCGEFDGTVFVGEVDSVVVGFVTILARYRSSEANEDSRYHGYVSDLVVLPAYRQRGFGRALLRAAETRTRDAGATSLRIAVMAGNAEARSLYSEEGFAEREIHLEKLLN